MLPIAKHKQSTLVLFMIEGTDFYFYFLKILVLLSVAIILSMHFSMRKTRLPTFRNFFLIKMFRNYRFRFFIEVDQFLKKTFIWLSFKETSEPFSFILRFKNVL